MNLNETFNYAANLLCENAIETAGMDLTQCVGKPGIMSHGDFYIRLNTKQGSGLFDACLYGLERVLSGESEQKALQEEAEFKAHPETNIWGGTRSLRRSILSPRTGTKHFIVDSIDPINKTLTFRWRNLDETTRQWQNDEQQETIRYFDTKRGLFGENFFGAVNAEKFPKLAVGYKVMPPKVPEYEPLYADYTKECEAEYTRKCAMVKELLKD